jgi:L-glyceraldehyde 3-phosphate reductase
MDTISDLIHQGKALYAGISNYKSEKAKEAAEILKRNRTPLLINQFRYNMFDRWSEEDGLLETLEKVGSGSITFSPLAQGLLSDKYLNGIPENSRAARNFFLKKDSITEEKIEKIRKLNKIAKERGQTLSQMALCWNLRSGGLTSVLIGAHSPEQIEENAKIVEKLAFSSDELDAIEGILGGE